MPWARRAPEPESSDLVSTVMVTCGPPDGRAQTPRDFTTLTESACRDASLFGT